MKCERWSVLRRLLMETFGASVVHIRVGLLLENSEDEGEFGSDSWTTNAAGFLVFIEYPRAPLCFPATLMAVLGEYI